jgi:hypothetical protein
VATPLNATNLNKMDKGIDDCDNAIEDLYSVKFDKANIANNLITTASGLALDARQGKALQDQITVQNNSSIKQKTVTISVPLAQGANQYDINSAVTGAITSGSILAVIPVFQNFAHVAVASAGLHGGNWYMGYTGYTVASTVNVKLVILYV